VVAAYLTRRSARRARWLPPTLQGGVPGGRGGGEVLTLVRLELLNKKARNTIVFLKEQYDLD
jgi:hypothetical protein